MFLKTIGFEKLMCFNKLNKQKLSHKRLKFNYIGIVEFCSMAVLSWLSDNYTFLQYLSNFMQNSTIFPKFRPSIDNWLIKSQRKFEIFFVAFNEKLLPVDHFSKLKILFYLIILSIACTTNPPIITTFGVPHYRFSMEVF